MIAAEILGKGTGRRQQLVKDGAQDFLLVLVIIVNNTSFQAVIQ